MAGTVDGGAATVMAGAVGIAEATTVGAVVTAVGMPIAIVIGAVVTAYAIGTRIVADVTTKTS